MRSLLQTQRTHVPFAQHYLGQPSIGRLAHVVQLSYLLIPPLRTWLDRISLSQATVSHRALIGGPENSTKRDHLRVSRLWLVGLSDVRVGVVEEFSRWGEAVRVQDHSQFLSNLSVTGERGLPTTPAHGLH